MKLMDGLCKNFLIKNISLIINKPFCNCFGCIFLACQVANSYPISVPLFPFAHKPYGGFQENNGYYTTTIVVSLRESAL